MNDKNFIFIWLNAEVANLKEMAQVGKNHIASLGENAVATYKKLMGDKADETIDTMLKDVYKRQEHMKETNKEILKKALQIVKK